MKAKLPHFNSFFKVYSQKKTMQYQLLNQSKMQISANLFFFLKAKLKKTCLIWILTSHLGQKIYIQEY